MSMGRGRVAEKKFRGHRTHGMMLQAPLALPSDVVRPPRAFGSDEVYVFVHDPVSSLVFRIFFLSVLLHEAFKKQCISFWHFGICLFACWENNPKSY